MKAMVLAAGVGSRLDPLTGELPKPLVPVAGLPVMEHILRLLKKHGFDEICANLHYMPEKIEEYFDNGSTLGIKLRLYKEENLSGDAGGVRTCRDFFKDQTFIVLSGDLLTDADLTAVIKKHKEKKAMASIALKQVENVAHFGVALLNKEGFITGFQEKPSPQEALSNLASTGIYVLEPEVFKYIPKDGAYGFGRQLFPSLIQQGFPVLGIEISDYWSDVGTIGQYKQSNLDALTGKVKVTIPGEVLQEKPYSVWIGKEAKIEAIDSLKGNLILGDNAIVKNGAQILGAAVIGANCVIESGAVINNSVIWPGSIIGANAKIENCVIASNCCIESGSNLNNIVSMKELAQTI